MDPNTKAEASLGQLAVSLGVLTVAQRDRMGVELFQRTRRKAPTSLARLLLQGGLDAVKVQELLAFGAHLAAVRCDACELGIPQSQLKKREEVACPRCGSLVLGFAAYAGAPNTPAGPKTASAEDEDDTKPLAPGEAAKAMAADTTEKWKGVLPVPAARAGAPREGAGTDRWPGVIALPPGPRSGPHALPAPTLPGTPNSDSGDDIGGRTMQFGNVLPAPSEGTIQLFPTGATGEHPRPPTAPVKLSAPPTGRPQPPKPAPPPAQDGDRTLAFGDVFLLPGRTAPKTDAEVTDEMKTLLAPAGMSALALSNGGTGGLPSGDLLPPGFDPGAVTAPLQRDEIQAMLRQGPPPPPPRSTQRNIGAPAQTIDLPPPAGAIGTPAAAPSATTTPAGAAGRKTGKRKTKGVAAAGSGRSKVWVIVLVLILALAGGTATAWKLGLLQLPK